MRSWATKKDAQMANLYIPLLIIFAVFGAFCFKMGHRR